LVSFINKFGCDGKEELYQMEGESMIKLGTINKYIEGRAKDKYKNVVKTKPNIKTKQEGFVTVCVNYNT
jgi:hypothetical protein